MKTEKQIRLKLIELAKDLDKYEEVNAKAGDESLNDNLEGQIDGLEWVLNEDD